MEDDGLIAARHCLEAMDGQDLETRQALWRAACRYAEKGRDARNPSAVRGSQSIRRASCFALVVWSRRNRPSILLRSWSVLCIVFSFKVAPLERQPSERQLAGQRADQVPCAGGPQQTIPQTCLGSARKGAANIATGLSPVQPISAAYSSPAARRAP